MKVFILNGSGRGQKGTTGKLVKALSDGLSGAGAEVKHCEIRLLKISPCIACLSCMYKTFGQCPVKDDMESIYGELKSADVLIMATPVYIDTMSAQLKAVMDRCMCCMLPFLTKDSSGRVRHPYAWRMPAKFLLISTAAFPEMETFAPLIATFRAEAANFGSEPIGEICIPGSVALQTEPKRLEQHLKLLEKAGKLIAETGGLSADILKALNTPPVTVEEYLTISAKYEAWCREQAKKNG
jgi:multimeric flavodoxin WrbA